MTDTFDCPFATVPVFVPMLRKRATIPTIEPMVSSTEMTMTLFIVLEIENGLNPADSHEAIQNIEDGKHDNDETCRFEEDT